MFCKHEIAKLLPKHIARIAKVSLSNSKLLFEEYLLDKASLKILTLPRSRRSTETLIHAFVSSRVDYCNSLLYGLPAYQLNKLQRVQNAAARLIFLESKYCHV